MCIVKFVKERKSFLWIPQTPSSVFFPRIKCLLMHIGISRKRYIQLPDVYLQSLPNLPLRCACGKAFYKVSMIPASIANHLRNQFSLFLWLPWNLSPFHQLENCTFIIVPI